MRSPVDREKGKNDAKDDAKKDSFSLPPIFLSLLDLWMPHVVKGPWPFPGCKGRYMNLMGHRTLNRERFSCIFSVCNKREIAWGHSDRFAIRYSIVLPSMKRITVWVNSCTRSFIFLWRKKKYIMRHPDMKGTS